MLFYNVFVFRSEGRKLYFYQVIFDGRHLNHNNGNLDIDLNGAGNGDRTRGIKLGKLALCQLSYART